MPAPSGGAGVGVGAVPSGTMLVTNVGVPPFISTTTAGFWAFRFASIVIRPVTPGKSFVSAMAFARSLPPSEGERFIASNRTLAAS